MKQEQQATKSVQWLSSIDFWLRIDISGDYVTSEFPIYGGFRGMSLPNLHQSLRNTASLPQRKRNFVQDMD